MTRSLFLRQLLWKEYRQQRDFWLALVIGGVVLQLLIAAAATLDNQAVPVDSLIGVAVAMPILFGIGCGATLFAGEHDAGTYQTLRSLPISAGQILVNKFALAVIGFLAIPIPLLLTAFVASPSLATWEKLGRLDLAFLQVIPLIALELFAWGAFFSLQTKRPLLSVVLSVAALGITSALIGFASMFMSQVSGRWDSTVYLQLMLHGVATALILLDDVWLAKGWLDELPRQFRRTARRVVPEKKPLVEGLENPAHSIGRMYSRLLWQEWRQSRGPMALIFVVVGIPGVFLLFIATRSGDRGALYPAICSLPILASVVGGCVFFGDQTRTSHRFLAEHGVGAQRHVWLSRHLLWGGALLIWTAVFLTFVASSIGSMNATAIQSHVYFPLSQIFYRSLSPTIYDLPRVLLGILISTGCMAIASYSAAQIASLYIRSGIVGLFVGLFLSLGVCLWCALMAIAGVPMLLSVLPVPMLCLWATWLRAPDWMVERTTLKARLRATVALASPILLALVVIAYRILEVPSVVLPSDNQQVAQPSAEALETLTLYYGAMEELLSSTESSTIESMGGSHSEMMGIGAPAPENISPERIAVASAEHQKTESARQTAEKLAALEKFLLATRRNECLFRYGPETDISKVQRFVHSVLDDVVRRETGGDHEGSLEFIFALIRYARHLHEANDERVQLSGDWVEAAALEQLVQWAGKNRTQEQIRQIADRLRDECFSHKPARDRAILAQHQIVSGILSGQNAGFGSSGQEVARYRRVASYMPWEKVRNQRLAAYYASFALDELSRAENNNFTFDVTLDQSKFDLMCRQIASSVMLPTLLNQHPRVHALAALRQEAVRRAALIRLIILATPASKPFQIEKQVPDPYSNNPFFYYPTGVPMSLLMSDPLYPDKQRAIFANTPFIWSHGPNLVVLLPKSYASNPNEIFRLYVRAVYGVIDDPPVRIQSMRELWERGLVFEIPERGNH